MGEFCHTHNEQTESYKISIRIIFFDFYNNRRLKELLRRRLIECGWRDQVKITCKELIKEHGLDIPYDTLLSMVISRARSLVPDSVKKELLQKIKSQLLAQEEKLKMGWNPWIPELFLNISLFNASIQRTSFISVATENSYVLSTSHYFISCRYNKFLTFVIPVFLILIIIYVKKNCYPAQD